MPLFKSKMADPSDEVESEPKSLAIAYSMKRKAKKAADGGMSADAVSSSNSDSGAAARLCTSACEAPCEVHESEGGLKSGDKEMDMIESIMNSRHPKGDGPTREAAPSDEFALDDSVESEDPDDVKDESRKDMVSAIMKLRRAKMQKPA